jgi:hypothetical protein
VVASLAHPTVISKLAPGAAIPDPGVAPAPPDYRGLDERIARTSDDELRKAVSLISAYFGDLVKLGGQPVIEQLRSMPEIKTYAPGTDDLSDVIRGLASPLDSAIRAFGRNLATIRATQGLVALRRWRLTHEGQLPESLSQATEAAGLDPLIDPYDGQPLRMATVDGRAVVYSVGRDGVDDGGRVDSENDNKPGDLIFTLPNSTHR